ncbi:DUF4062 domain-containing protein [Curtobacterium sp. MCBD17_008]|uniref:DUF4062 domain-containing protein n=1 Tax=Curtobacterium sp. MCBD17_008 TaxID=2175656 RepID=UPI000DA8845B|nr:DUF4062 domain-containing protein [Curtobacterium sp. MCBD17_008]PZE95177.1 DUF4062 domain-containing protein [Curtobacterium sp. MCBD17_008]
MTYVATVLRVMIASPSDVNEARDAVERAIHSWNDANSENKAVILQPWRWETSAVPVLGGHPQRLINSQGVDKSDVVFAMFAGRMGSATPDAISGTAEEIDRALEAGKPVHLYFSTADLPSNVDIDQLEAVRAFRSDMLTRGLLGEYSNVSQLEHEVWKAIEHDIAAMSISQSPQVTNPTAIDFLVQPKQERDVTYDSKGKPKNRTRHWIEVTNTGTADAEGVRFASVGQPTSLHLAASEDATVIHHGQTRRINTLYTMGGGESILRVSWVDGDGEHSKDFHVD